MSKGSSERVLRGNGERREVRREHGRGCMEGVVFSQDCCPKHGHLATAIRNASLVSGVYILEAWPGRPFA